MPIYEYQTVDPERACSQCVTPFEVLQDISEMPLTNCPHCGEKVRKVISRCHAAVIERNDESLGVEKKIKEYENSGMWSHAAELADSHSEKTKDTGLKMRALDNYRKAGYDADTLAKSAKLDEA